VKFYGYARCSTCRKALAWLGEHGLVADVVDITLTPPSRAELEQALSQIGRAALLNTSGQSYRAIGASAVKSMDDATLLAALAADGRLVKRPLLITDQHRILTGFKPEQWQEALSG
jgi:arsenate reductase